ncbi:MAG: C1 family peptidase [Candidatus Asgardarchaeia archaeon]
MSKIKQPFLSGGLFKDPPDEKDYKFEALPDKNRILKTASSLPPKIDRIPEMSPVKYQGALGSCVGFAVCALKEWQERKEHEAEVEAGKKDHRKDREYNFSEQWVYWNAKKIDPWGPDVQGTNLRSGFKVIHKIGVPTEKGWPYRDDPINIGEPKQWAHMVAKWATIDSYWSIESGSVEGLKRALVEGPAVVAMPCFEEMYGLLVNGKIPYPSKPNEDWGWHAILVIGYDDAEQVFQLKNSWSQFWGAAGYGYLPYSYYADFCGDPWLAKDLSVTRDMLKGTSNLLD